MGERKETVLILEDNKEYSELLTAALRADYEPLPALTLQRARQRIEQGVAAVLCDIRLSKDDPSNRDGLKLVEELAESHPTVPFIVMTNYGDIELAVAAMKAGAADFIQKENLDLRELPKVIANGVARYRLRQRVNALENDLRRLQPWDMIGDDPSIREIQRIIDQVAADGQVNVLITGESGTGKELVARAIHTRGPRRERPFVPVAIAGLPRSTIESELFGHVKGAFTGADAGRLGYFEQAQGGVLFLDEVGELDSDLQVKLLRALETRSFARLGSTTPVEMDVQLVSATNCDMAASVKRGQIRQDFYFRIKTVEIRLPPLRERAGDITLLAEYFLSTFRNQGRTRVTGFAAESLDQLHSYPFPGNIRELRSIVERGMILAGSKGRKYVEGSDLLLSVPSLDMPISSVAVQIESGIDLDHELARCELSYADAALRTAAGKKDNAWRLLGLNDRFALRRRIKAIMERYPDLVTEFSLLCEQYG